MAKQSTVGSRAILLALMGLLAQGDRGWPQDRDRGEPEPLVEQVRHAIDRGVQFLRDQENGQGHWEVSKISALTHGGETCLALLALLNAGVKPDDPVIERGLKFLRANVPPKMTYVVGLQTMVYAAAGKDVDRERIQANVKWLIDARVLRNNATEGWSYGMSGRGGDNSNTQYALLGLHEAHLAGAKIDEAVWRSIREYYMRTQSQEGAWSYSPGLQGGGGTLTMTTAGLCGLLISGMEMNVGREVIRPDGQATNCGVYEENPNVEKALKWIGEKFRIQPHDHFYYNLYGIERAGRLSARRFLGSHDWYREGCERLVLEQNKIDGSWRGTRGEPWPVVCTSFALLFLSKGRTPILISKFVHGPGQDWNNDRHDVRNLVNYSSRELFQKKPLAWQIFDAKRATLDNREELLRTTADLLQSPIVYFNGHEAPEFADAEEQLLREYVDQGGFILAEACCGKPGFDRGFRALMDRMFKENNLEKLSNDHPIWRAYAPVAPNKDFELYGIQQGCKTVVVYSPRDLSCWWESNRLDIGKGQEAFRLGANIVAYATGGELPKPRLTPVEVVSDKEDKLVPRGYLKAAQVRHEGDWQPAPRAMRNLMFHLREKARLDVALQTQPIGLGDKGLFDFKFLYMHGRNEFSFRPEQIDNLRANLQTGGLLLADACCGKKEFDKSFRAFAAKLFPDKNLEVISPADELFGKELNGDTISTVRCRRERVEGGGAEAGFHEVPPLLEGIKVNNRWVVIYSRYDLGCALEKHKSSDCLGHDHASALKLGSAAVLYALRR